MAFIAAPIIAQTIISGTVMEAGNMHPLPFVNIGIKQNNFGTVSTGAGKFTLSVPADNYNDTLTFSMVGYDDCNLSIASASADQQTIILKPSKHHLNEVTISTRKLKQHKYGLTANPILHFTDGSIQQNDAFEIAQLMKLGNTVGKLTALYLHVNEARTDSCTFRINFYSYEANRPGERVVYKSILQTHAIKPGWLQFDLSKYNVYLKGNVVAGIEFLPSEKKNGPIVYEIKPGSRSKSFVRRSSLGTWQVPPHQYRMYVTTLSSDDMLLEEVQKDAMPDHKLYSKYVNDTFSLFIRMPDGYEQHNGDRYPVVYLLDANLYFDQVSESIGDIKGVQPILVGIGYNNFLEMDSLRNRDYTYPVALAADSFSVSGGADKFYDFVCRELLPDIDNQYRTDGKNRCIMGHSLGGYFTLYALLKDLKGSQPMFNHYVSASPSIDYHDQYLLKEFNSISTTKITPKNVFITYSNVEEDDNTSENNHYLYLIKHLVTNAKKISGIKIKEQQFQHAAHMETAVPSFLIGLQHK